MQEYSDGYVEEINKKKQAPIVAAVIVIMLLSIFLAILVFPLILAAMEDVFAFGILLLYILFVIVEIIGVVIALKQRLQEIDGGEEEEAKKY